MTGHDSLFLHYIDILVNHFKQWCNNKDKKFIKYSNQKRIEFYWKLF